MRLIILLLMSMLSGCGNYYGYLVSHDLDRKSRVGEKMAYEYDIKTKHGVVVLSLASSVEVPIEKRRIVTVDITNHGADFVALYESSDGNKAKVIRRGESARFRVYPPRMGFTASTQHPKVSNVDPNISMEMKIKFSGLPMGLEKTNLLEKASQ